MDEWFRKAERGVGRDPAQMPFDEWLAVTELLISQQARDQSFAPEFYLRLFGALLGRLADLVANAVDMARLLAILPDGHELESELVGRYGEMLSDGNVSNPFLIISCMIVWESPDVDRESPKIQVILRAMAHLWPSYLKTYGWSNLSFLRLEGKVLAVVCQSEPVEGVDSFLLGLDRMSLIRKLAVLVLRLPRQGDGRNVRESAKRVLVEISNWHNWFDLAWWLGQRDDPVVDDDLRSVIGKHLFDESNSAMLQKLLTASQSTLSAAGLDFASVEARLKSLSEA
ncbi:MAG: hypothetical protein ABIJ46_02015 [bacterium]